MFFTPRVNPLIALAMVTGLMAALVLGAEEVMYVIGGVLSVYLVLAVLFNSWNSPEQ